MNAEVTILRALALYMHGACSLETFVRIAAQADGSGLVNGLELDEAIKGLEEHAERLRRDLLGLASGRDLIADE